MKFFEECRPEFYFHGGRLTKDAKSGKQFWKLNLVVTLKPGEVAGGCDDVIRNNYVAIETRENRVEEIKLADVAVDQVIEFFSLEDHKAAVLRCGPCDLTELRITREDDLTELWVKAEIENSDEVSQVGSRLCFPAALGGVCAASNASRRGRPRGHGGPYRAAAFR